MAERPRVAEERLAEIMLELAAARGPAKTICPSEVARAAAGDHPDAWSPLMPPVRRVALALMRQGRVVILRKGRPVDPEGFRGIYRIRLAGSGDHSGPGNSDVV